MFFAVGRRAYLGRFGGFLMYSFRNSCRPLIPSLNPQLVRINTPGHRALVALYLALNNASLCETPLTIADAARSCLRVSP